MQRREFITLIGGAAAAWPLIAGAQQLERMRRIGFLGLDSASHHAPRLDALRAGLRDHGYVEGQNIVIEFRWAEGNYERLPALADELVRLNVDVLVTHGSSGALAAKKATSTIPIVITAVGDMLSLGLVSSLSRPGGNITGLSNFASELTTKCLELLKETIPSLTTVAALLNPDNASYQFVLKETEAAAKAMKVELKVFDVREPSNFERTFSAMADQQIGAVVIHEDTMLRANAKAIADLAITKRLPSSGFPDFVRAGCLIGYGINFPDMDYRAAAFIDEILKGAKPSDLPVERSTKFNIIVNLKTAKTLGLTIPRATARPRRRDDRMSDGMSAFGTKQTSLVAPHMSAFGGKADMPFCTANVRF